MSRFDKFLAVLTLGIVLVGSIWGQVPTTNYNQVQWDDGATTPGSCQVPGFFYNSTLNQLLVCRLDSTQHGHFSTFFVPSPFTPSINAGTDVICALHADVITGLTCNNQVTDGSTETPFSTSVTLPSASIGNTTVHINMLLGVLATATIPTIQIKIKIGGTTILTGTATAATAGSRSISVNCLLVIPVAVSATSNAAMSCTGTSFNTSPYVNTLNTNSALVTQVNLVNNPALTVTATFGANTTQNAIWLYALDTTS